MIQGNQNKDGTQHFNDHHLHSILLFSIIKASTHNLHTYIKLIENMEYSFPPSIKNLITLNDYCRLDIKCGNEHGLQDLFIYINHWENYGGVYSGANMPWYKIDQPEYRYKPLVTKP